MANNKSALKRIRQTKVRTERNKALKSKVKSLRKKTLEAAAEGNAGDAQEAMKALTSVLDRAVKKSVLHKNKAANVKAKTVKAMKAGAGA
jgi:small subunit ribosomal protein S20